MLDPMRTYSLLRVVELEVNRSKKSESMIGIPLVTYFDSKYDEAMSFIRPLGFSFIDCSLFSQRNISNEQFCKEIGFKENQRFLLILPRHIPFAICMLIVHLDQRGAMVTESGISSSGSYENGASKAWLAMMARNDYDHMALETGWPPTKIKQIFTPHVLLD